jgi:hypothetical protein
MTSPRLFQDHLERTRLERTLPSAAMVGANFKFHINSALLALSPFERHDVLHKTAIFFNDVYSHSNVPVSRLEGRRHSRHAASGSP